MKTPIVINPKTIFWGATRYQGCLVNSIGQSALSSHSALSGFFTQ
jgi:hypothetical protein